MTEYERAVKECDELKAAGKFWPNLEELMWRAIRARLGVNNFAKVTWGECWRAAKEMGWPLTREQEQAIERMPAHLKRAVETVQ
jgi:hypothetical protein